jgi:hypothetical protein
MNRDQCQSLPESRWESRVSVNNFGNILISTFIAGFGLIMIIIFVSFTLFAKTSIK